MKNLLFTLAGVACLTLAGCNNDDDDANNIGPTATRMELLTNQDWVLVSDIQTTNGRSIDNIDEISVRSRDDIFRFKPNGEAVRDEGPTKEDGNPQIVESATWSFANEEKSLDVAFKSLPINDEIVEISKSRLVLRRTLGDSEKLTTFEAQ